MYLQIFKNGLTMDGSRFKDQVLAQKYCPVLQAIPPNQSKAVKRQVIKLSDFDLREIKTEVRKAERLRKEMNIELEVPVPALDENVPPPRKDTAAAATSTRQCTSRTTPPVRPPPVVRSRPTTHADPKSELLEQVKQLQDRVALLETTLKARLPNPCPIHPCEPITLYCRTCHQIACVQCMISRHLDHHVADLKTIIREQLGHENTSYAWFVEADRQSKHHILPLNISPFTFIGHLTTLMDLNKDFRIVPNGRWDSPLATGIRVINLKLRASHNGLSCPDLSPSKANDALDDPIENVWQIEAPFLCDMDAPDVTRCFEGLKLENGSVFIIVKDS